MLEVLIGMVSGVVSGTGMGGGTILILLLTLFMGINQHVAQATNLVFFIPTSISAIIMNIKEKNVNLRIGIQVSLFGIVGAIIGAIISSGLEVNMLRKYFGIFLAIIGIFQIYSLIKEYIFERNRNNKNEHK